MTTAEKTEVDEMIQWAINCSGKFAGQTRGQTREQSLAECRKISDEIEDLITQGKWVTPYEFFQRSGFTGFNPTKERKKIMPEQRAQALAKFLSSRVNDWEDARVWMREMFQLGWRQAYPTKTCDGDCCLTPSVPEHLLISLNIIREIEKTIKQKLRDPSP